MQLKHNTNTNLFTNSEFQVQVLNSVPEFRNDIHAFTGAGAADPAAGFGLQPSDASFVGSFKNLLKGLEVTGEVKFVLELFIQYYICNTTC